MRTYFKRFLPLFFAAFALMICRVVCELEVPNLMSDIVDTGILNGDIPYIVDTGSRMILWALGAMVADILCDLSASRASMGYGRELRSAVYKRVSDFSLHETEGFGTSTLITRTTNDVQQLERFTQMTMTVAMMSPIMLVGASFMSLSMNVQLASIIFCAIPVLLVIAIIVMRIAMPYMRSLQRRIDKLNRITREGLTGMRVIRAYRREPYEEARFSVANEELAETNVKVARRMSTLMPIITLVLNIVVVLIVWMGAKLIDAGSFQVGDLMAIIQYGTQVLMSTMMLSSVIMIWPRASAAGERVKAVLECDPTIQDPEEPAEIPEEMKTRPHEVRFEHVSFTFPDAQEEAISDVDLTLEPGKTYALIGATGSGKSTLINLLMRFYEPSTGRIAIDGVDIADMRQEDLHRLIAYVPQKTTLFAGTIADNIRYGREDASDEEVVAAAKAAQAHDFIMGKEKGYETRITQAGGGLSGGQKQRVAIARALVKRSGLFIFDDSFSALDFKTDAAVRTNLARVTKGATVLIVAQRVAAAMDADQVIVVNEGRIEAVGTHEELLDTCQVYNDIVASQIDEEEAR